MANFIDDKDIKQAAQPQFNANQPRRVGTGFTNVQRILGANVGNRLGQTIGQGVGQLAQQTKQNLGQTQQQFQQKAQQGLIGTEANQARAQSVIGSGDVDTAVNVAQQDPNMIADFAKYRSGSYGGPRSFQDVTDQNKLTGQAREAEELGQAATSQGGRAQLLQRFAGNPNYTSGQRQLDSLLLGRENLSGVRRSTAGLTSDVNRQAEAAKAMAQNIESQNKAFAQRVQTGLQGLQGKFQSGLEQERQGLAQGQQEFAGRVQQAFAPGEGDIQLTAEDAAKLGLTGGQRIGVLSSNDLQLMAARPDVSLQEVATPEDLAKYNILQQLSGQTDGYLRDDQSTLGAYRKALQEQQRIDPRRIQAAVDEAQSRLESQLTPLQQQAAHWESARVANEELMKGIRQGDFYNASGSQYSLPQASLDPSRGEFSVADQAAQQAAYQSALQPVRQREMEYAAAQNKAVQDMIARLRAQAGRKVSIKE